MEFAIMEYAMSYCYWNWYGQEDFARQEIWRTSIYYLLEWPFSELFSCRFLIVSYKISIITGISNETRNEITIYAILCQNVTVFYQKELPSLF